MVTALLCGTPPKAGDGVTMELLGRVVSGIICPLAPVPAIRQSKILPDRAGKSDRDRPCQPCPLKISFIIST